MRTHGRGGGPLLASRVVVSGELMGSQAEQQSHPLEDLGSCCSRRQKTFIAFGFILLLCTARGLLSGKLKGEVWRGQRVKGQTTSREGGLAMAPSPPLVTFSSTCPASSLWMMKSQVVGFVHLRALPGRCHELALKPWSEGQGRRNKPTGDPCDLVPETRLLMLFLSCLSLFFFSAKLFLL